MPSVQCRYCNRFFDTENVSETYCSCCNHKFKRSSSCLICGIRFEHPGLNVCCSEECLEDYINKCKTLISDEKIENVCRHCKKHFYANQQRRFCSLRCGFQSINKISEKEYFTFTNGILFNDILRSCLNSNSLIVPKTWGLEVHIVNHHKYCLKYLVFFKDQYFSNHMHLVKQEAWHCLVGGFEMILRRKNAEATFSYLKEAGKIELEPGTEHQIRALDDSILVEVSTQSFNEDTIRSYSNI